MRLHYLTTLVVVVVMLATATNAWSLKENPDDKRNISQIIVARGYAEEDHHVVTPDGFILSLQRIPASRYQPNPAPYAANGRPAVILQHGVEDIGTSWVIQENVYQSFGFILADAGFDVWISNVRGTTYSNSHIKYKPTQKEFWAWSFDEMAEFDLPTVIDYVLNVTGHSTVGYAGHSQGTTMGFIGFTNPELVKKINLFVAFAPVVRVTHCTSKLLDTLADLDLANILELLGEKAFLPDTPTMQRLMPLLCGTDPDLCQNFLGLIMGFDLTNINNTRLPVIMAHEPGGTSVQNVVHWSQCKKHGYRKYSYGPVGNLEKYGHMEPPSYNISQFDASLIIFYGGHDDLADLTDVQWLIPELGDKLLYQKFIPSYSHIDFVWGENAYEWIYNEAVDFLQKFAPSSSSTHQSRA